MTVKVVAAIAPRVERAEIERARRRPSGNTDAYDCYLRGLACLIPCLPTAGWKRMRLFTTGERSRSRLCSRPTQMAMWCHANRIGFRRAEDIEHERSEVDAAVADALCGSVRTMVWHFRQAA